MLISLHEASLSELIKLEVRVSSLTLWAINQRQHCYSKSTEQRTKDVGKATNKHATNGSTLKDAEKQTKQFFKCGIESITDFSKLFYKYKQTDAHANALIHVFVLFSQIHS